MTNWMTLLIFTILINSSISYTSENEKVLQFNGNRLSERKGNIIYCPNCNRKSAHYTHYIFSNSHFKKILGDPKEIDSAKIRVKIIETKYRTYKPKSQYEQSPQGGFRIIEHYCKIIKIIKIEKKD